MTASGSTRKILALSDKVVPYVFSSSVKEHFGDVEMVVGCGDLRRDYLEYVISMLDKPLYYVPGNHDPDDFQVPGGQSVDVKVARYRGALIAGAGGSVRYKVDGRHQYTQRQMYLRIFSMLPRLFILRLRRGYGVDFFLTHAAPFGVQDGPDPAHTGFRAFHSVIKIARPRYLLHGHMHIHRNLEQSKTRIADTWVLNVYPQREIAW